MRYNDKPITDKQAVDLLKTTFGVRADQMLAILKTQRNVVVKVDGGVVSG